MAQRVGRLLPGVFVTTGNPDTTVDAAVSTTNVGSGYDLTGQLGALYRSADGLKEWIYVQFSATATGKATAANQLLYYMSSTTTTLNPTWVVDNQTTANSGITPANVAGVLRTTSTSLAGKYIWALRKAPSANVVSTTTGYLKGNSVIATTASGEASFITSTSTTIASTLGALGFGLPVIGLVNSTTTSSVNIDVELDIQ
jgi:hypothetical protein